MANEYFILQSFKKKVAFICGIQKLFCFTILGEILFSMKWLFIFSGLLLSFSAVHAQTTEDLAVELSATVQTSPAQVTLHWKMLTVDTPVYHIWKKAKTSTSWGTEIAILPATDSAFTDTAVIIDSAYEYQVWALGTTLSSSGYIYAGIRNPAIHNKGTLLLIIDSTFSDSCAAAIKTMMDDMSGDGWQIIRHDLARTLPDTAVKAIIANDYASHADVKSVLLLGHIAVPYSANFDTVIYPPDGHVPYHDGAWPSDVYYACMTGWTDVAPPDTFGSYIANWNIPGDGKWDQFSIPSSAVLQVSRIDVYNMPSFAASEVQMMNSYLAKDHIYKMDSLAMIHRALISDNFGYFGGEGFAANGWRNFAPLVGRDSVYVLPFISSLAASSYQWAYGCGGGSFTSAGGIGSTTDFAANPVNGIFTMLFGSYFGDWNVQDNFLRAPLCAATPALTCCWAGRPNWFFHHMTLGENIGYAAWLTQNNADPGLYQPANYGAQGVYVALMGDLTLRADYIKPPSNLMVSTPVDSGAILTWTASPDTAVIGYYVYRADSVYGYYQRISGMLTATAYHDLLPGISGLKYYMVRPVKLQSTPSGGYYDLGVGITDTGTVTSTSLQVTVLAPEINLSVFPNPAQNYLNAKVSTDIPGIVTMYVVNETGQRFNICTKQLNKGNNYYSLNITGMAPGVYALIVKCGDNTFIQKWVKI